jgi:hypothetical protein
MKEQATKGTKSRQQVTTRKFYFSDSVGLKGAEIAFL